MENSRAKSFIRLFSQLEKDFGWDIILYDFYGIYRTFEELSGLFEIEYKWHSNPYCMQIKSNDGLFEKCVILKDRFLIPKIKKGKSFWGRCYCGVTEYIVPIKVSGVIVAALNVSGYYEKTYEKGFDFISKRLDMDCGNLMKMHKQYLKKLDASEKRRVEIYMEVLSNELKILGENTLFKENIKTNAELSGNNLIFLNTIDYIKKHYSEEISPEMIARALNISLSHLQHVFSQKSGHGVATEIRDYRLSIAAELLYTTERSVKSVAISVGYINVDYFSVLFKRKFGMSPLEYRKQRF